MQISKLICKPGELPLLPGQVSAQLGKVDRTFVQRETSSRQKQPYARVHSSKEVWAGFQHPPLSGIFTQYSIRTAVYCSLKHKTCFDDWIVLEEISWVPEGKPIEKIIDYFSDFFFLVKYWDEASAQKWTSQCVTVFLCEIYFLQEQRRYINLFS